MMVDLPQDLIVQVQRYTGFPWWNGRAYAENAGYPQTIKKYETGVASAVDDLFDVMEWLREEKIYEKADRLRTIAGRLARLLPDNHSDHPEWIIVQARGWK